MAALEHIDPRWTWHHCALLRLRQGLLHAAGGSVTRQPGELATCPPDHHHSSHEVVIAESFPLESRLPEVDAALARIRAHTYGICEITGQPIPAARLRAMPWVRCALPASERSTSPSSL